MKRLEVNRIILSVLLAVVFAIPVITKVIHAYENECHKETCSHSGEKHEHDCNTCPVCQFILSAFTGVDFLAPTLSQSKITSQLISFYQKNVYTSTLTSNQLRAPPALIA